VEQVKTLLFTGGGVHDSKGCGEVINEILQSVEELETTWVHDDMDALLVERLEPFDLIVLYYTRGEISDPQKNGLLNHIAAGKSFVGIHCATASFRETPEFHAMLGGLFIGHPKPRPYQVSVVDPEHPITKDITEFMVEDEQYAMDYDPRVNVLCSALWKGEAMPVAWTKSWGKGNVYYLALGHTPKDCQHEMFKTLLIRGCLWAAHVRA